MLSEHSAAQSIFHPWPFSSSVELAFCVHGCGSSQPWLEIIQENNSGSSKKQNVDMSHTKHTSPCDVTAAHVSTLMFLLAPHRSSEGSNLSTSSHMLWPQAHRGSICTWKVQNFPGHSRNSIVEHFQCIRHCRQSSNLNRVGGYSDKIAKLFYRGDLSIYNGLGTNPLADAW